MTNCAFPPELDDKTLLLYLDGGADSKTLSHLERCAHCRRKAEALDRFQKRLTSKLYRVDCPSSMELAEYQFRMLPTSQMLVVGQHLRRCPHCVHELNILEDFLREDMTQSEFLGQVKVLIAQLVKGGDMNKKADQPSFNPAMAGLRGNGDEPFIYQVENIQVIIEVQDDMEQPDLKMVLGLVIGLEIGGFTVQARQGGQVSATSLIDEIGNFTINQLPRGVYDLILQGPETEIQIKSFIV